jgi:hypothetical protein
MQQRALANRRYPVEHKFGEIGIALFRQPNTGFNNSLGVRGVLLE